jgi:uncharacterized lipoprotein YmbA
VIRNTSLVVAALLAGGCSIFQRRPPLEQYTIVIPRTEDGATTPVGPPVLQGTLAVMPYVTRGIYDERGIVYRVDDLRLQPYPSREWSVPLGEMLGVATVEMLERRSVTSEPPVFDPRLPRASTYQWRGTVREFEEVNRARQVLASVYLEVEIVRSAGDSVIWRGSERIERPVPVPTNSMNRVVETLSSITGDVLARLIDRARSELGTPTAAAAPPPE